MPALPTTQTFESPVDSIIRDLNVAFRAFRRDLSETHPSGELTLSLTFPTRMDADFRELSVPKIELKFYHYQSYNAWITAEGLEWEEVKSEMFRRLSRDKTLKRLTNLKSEE